VPVEVVADQIRAVGWETTILATDFGQHFNLPAPKGLELFLQELARCGIPEKHLAACVKDHPAALLGL
jgi:hypothetical protein